jgi:hypothetical protein
MLPAWGGAVDLVRGHVVGSPDCGLAVAATTLYAARKADRRNGLPRKSKLGGDAGEDETR